MNTPDITKPTIEHLEAYLNYQFPATQGNIPLHEFCESLRRQSVRQIEQEVLDEIDKGGDAKCNKPPQLDNTPLIVSADVASSSAPESSILTAIARTQAKQYGAGWPEEALAKLFPVIRQGLETAYLLGHTDADYEAGRALDSLESAPVEAWRDLGEELAGMVIKYVEGGINGGTNWRNGLAEIITLHLQRRVTQGEQP